LTIIFELGNEFWIEVFETVATAVTAGGNDVQDFTLTKAGFFLGVSASMNINANTAPNIAPMAHEIANVDDSNLSIGQAITAIRTRTVNDGLASRTIKLSIILLMRGSAR